MFCTFLSTLHTTSHNCNAEDLSHIDASIKVESVIENKTIVCKLWILFNCNYFRPLIFLKVRRNSKSKIILLKLNPQYVCSPWVCSEELRLELEFQVWQAILKAIQPSERNSIQVLYANWGSETVYISKRTSFEWFSCCQMKNFKIKILETYKSAEEEAKRLKEIRKRRKEPNYKVNKLLLFNTQHIWRMINTTHAKKVT